MATFVNDLRLTELATGEASGTWGQTTNTNLELVAEAFSFGTEAITTNADTHTTTIADGSTDPGRSIFLKYTGTLDSACTITIGPNTVSKLWFIENATSGSQSIIISQGSGADITIPNGQTKAIYSDGAGSGAAMVDAFQDLSIPDLFVDDDLTVGDDLILSSDGAIVKFGADADTTLTHTDGSGLTLNSTNKLMFNDASQFIQGSSATVLSLGATDEIDLTATAIDVNGTMDVSGAITSSAGATITVADNSNALTLVSTDADANSGPVLQLYRNSSSPADDDVLGEIEFDGENDAGEQVQYGLIAAKIQDASDGTEDTRLSFKTIVAGTTRERITIQPGETVLNEDSVDLDFRVESDARTHGFFVDGGTSAVSIGVAPRSDIHSTWGQLFLGEKGSLISENLSSGGLFGMHVSDNLYVDSDTGAFAYITADEASVYTQEAGTHKFFGVASGSAGAAATTISRLEIDASGNVVFNEGSNDSDFRVESNGNVNAILVDAGNDRVGILNDGTMGSNFNVLTQMSIGADNNNRAILDFSSAAFSIGTIQSGTATFSAFSVSSGAVFCNNSTSLGTSLILNNTSNGSGSTLKFLNDSSSPANDDVLGSIDFNGNDDGGTQTTFARIRSSASNVANGSEDGNLTFSISDDASILEHMRINTAGVVVNENSQAGTDFRVETNSNNSAFFIDSSDDEIELNANTFSGAQFTLGSSSFFLNVTNGYRFNDQANSVNLCIIGNSGEMVVNEGSQDYDFRVESNNKSSMFFVDGGNDCVVIGGSTVETSDQFEVLGNDSNTTVRIRNTNAGAAGPLLVFDKSSSSPANDDVCGEIRFLGNDSSGNATQFAGFKVESGNVTNGGEDAITTYGMQVNGSYQNMFNMNHIGTTFNEGGIGALDFRVESTSASHMLYVNSGDNTVTFDNSDFSTIDGSSATGVAIRTAGRMVFCGTDGGNIMEFNINGTGNVGTIRLSGSNTAYNTTSDERLKENIADAEDAGAIIDAIQVRQFDWKTDGEHQRYGMVAQELNTVTPEAVTVPDDPEKMQSVDYSKLVPMLIKEIQSLRSRIEKLEGE